MTNENNIFNRMQAVRNNRPTNNGMPSYLNNNFAPQQQYSNYVEARPEQSNPNHYLMNIFSPNQFVPIQPQQEYEVPKETFNYPKIEQFNKQMATISMLRTQLENGANPEQLLKRLPDENKYLLDHLIGGGMK